MKASEIHTWGFFEQDLCLTGDKTEHRDELRKKSFMENQSQLHDNNIGLLVFGSASFRVCFCVHGRPESPGLCPHVKPREAKNNTSQSAVD